MIEWFRKKQLPRQCGNGSPPPPRGEEVVLIGNSTNWLFPKGIASKEAAGLAARGREDEHLIGNAKIRYTRELLGEKK